MPWTGVVEPFLMTRISVPLLSSLTLVHGSSAPNAAATASRRIASLAMAKVYHPARKGCCTGSGSFPVGEPAVHRSDMNPLGDSQPAQNRDLDPGKIELVPRQAMPRRRGVSVMVVVPPFAEGKDR